MSDSPEQQQRQRQEQASPREEAALPVAAPGTHAHTGDASSKRRTILRVVGGTLVFVVAMSVVLEYAGWEIAFRTMAGPRASIEPLSFLRGVWDTTLGAIGVGAGTAIAALLIPSSWQRSWRRAPAAFAVGAGAFIAFLSFVTFGFFG